MKLVLISVVLIALAAPARGAEETPAKIDRETGSTSEKIQDNILTGLYAATVAVQVYDARLTIDALATGAHEANPMLTGVVGNSGWTIGVALARAAAIDIAVASIARRHKLFAIGVAAGINSTYLMIAAHNRGVIDSMHAQGR
jgi:hypothetical protein